MNVGETGVLLYVPEGAITGNVTFTFKRMPIDESKLAAGHRGQNLVGGGFTSADGNSWREGAGKLPQLGCGVFGFGSPCVTGPFGRPTCGCVGFNCGFGGSGAFGIAQSDRGGASAGIWNGDQAVSDCRRDVEHNCRDPHRDPMSVAARQAC